MDILLQCVCERTHPLGTCLRRIKIEDAQITRRILKWGTADRWVAVVVGEFEGTS